SEIGISEPFVPPVNATNIEIKVQIKEYKAIWDTGATHSVITSKIVQDLNLKPVGMAIVHTANGQANQKQYMVNLYLPSQVMVGMLRVTEAPLHEADVLIGMDIISKGDFCVTNFQGKTVLTFRMPSCGEIDFVKEHELARLPRSERRRMEKERGKI
ncbi:MAG: retropepsin-like aspartic protease, partial [Candidatus Gracilibacteria bacterium]